MIHSTVTDITAHFPHPVLDIITGTPTYTTLAPLFVHLNANASEIPSVLGGGSHGHLGLTLPPTEYVALTNSLFVSPTYPGSPPPINGDKSVEENKLLQLQHRQLWDVYNT